MAHLGQKYLKATQKDIEFLKEVYSDKSIKFDERVLKIRTKYNINERQARRLLSTHGISTPPKSQESPEYEEAKKRKLNKEAKVYIFTWAQNDTPVHKEFLENIEAYAKFRGADIHVILGRYKNPTSVFTDKEYDTWAKEVLKYKDANRHKLHKHLAILSDVKIQPTAANPLSGMEGFSGINSCVVGHPKIHMKPIASFEGYKTKYMFTTGAVTQKNYTDSKSGKKGEFHHTFGFVIVEIKDKDTFFIRNVTATEQGDFCDAFYEVKDKKISVIKTLDAAVLGDIHWGETCPKVHTTQKKWLDKLRPKHTILHDIFSGYSITHHEEDDPIKMYRKFEEGRDDLQNEIDELLDWLDTMKEYNLVIPSANHNDFVDRWVKRVNWKSHIRNALKYIEYAQILLSGKAKDGIIAYLVKKRFGSKIKLLGRDKMFSVDGFELANHGDIGVNGSRGSSASYRKLNVKMINGHSHTPLREDGVYYAGTSTRLRVGFNIGASSWGNADVWLHTNKKAQHILYFNGEFTTIDYMKLFEAKIK